MMPAPALALAAVVLVAAAAAPASALVACRTTRGEVVLRDGCRKKEAPLALADFGLEGAQGAPGADGAPGRAPLHLVDAEETEIGPVVYADVVPVTDSRGVYLVAVVQESRLGGASLIAAGFSGETVGLVFHATSDCSGAPLVENNGLLPVLQVIGDTAFRATTPAGAVTVAATESNDRSLGCSSLTPRGGCCQSRTPTARSDLSNTSAFSPLGFRPPFRVRSP